MCLSLTLELLVSSTGLGGSEGLSKCVLNEAVIQTAGAYATKGMCEGPCGASGK